jgi:hypothetical protein
MKSKFINLLICLFSIATFTISNSAKAAEPAAEMVWCADGCCGQDKEIYQKTLENLESTILTAATEYGPIQTLAVQAFMTLMNRDKTLPNGSTRVSTISLIEMFQNIILHELTFPHKGEQYSQEESSELIKQCPATKPSSCPHVHILGAVNSALKVFVDRYPHVLIVSLQEFYGNKESFTEASALPITWPEKSTEIPQEPFGMFLSEVYYFDQHLKTKTSSGSNPCRNCYVQLLQVLCEKLNPYWEAELSLQQSPHTETLQEESGSEITIPIYTSEDENLNNKTGSLRFIVANLLIPYSGSVFVVTTVASIAFPANPITIWAQLPKAMSAASAAGACAWKLGTWGFRTIRRN